MRRLAVSVLSALALAPGASAHVALGVVRDVSGASASIAAAPGRAPVPAPGRAPDFAREAPGVGTGAGVSYGGGPILTSNRTHVIFWAPSGSHLAFDPGYRALVERFLIDVAAASHSTNNVFALTGQYTDSANRPAAYASRYAGSILDTDRLPRSECVEPPATGPGWTVCLTDSQLQAEIEHVVRARHLPTGQRDVYFLVTPRGLGSCMATSPTSGCALGGPATGYCGYHKFTNDNLVDYAFIPYNAMPGHCQSAHPRPNGSSADPALSTIGHELAEMITDPDGDAWTGSGGQEIADMCITTFGPTIGGSGNRRYNQDIAGGHFYLQDLWSNASGGCEARAKPDHASFDVTARSGQTLSLEGSAADPEGRIVAYHWTFGGGGRAHGRSISHRFPGTGSYPIRLRVTDSWGNWGFYTRTVPVR
jgi:hypothetical protein